MVSGLGRRLPVSLEFPAMNDDDIREMIKAKKKARSQNRKHTNGHNIKVLRSILGPTATGSPAPMKVGKVYTLVEIEVFIEKAGGKYSSAGPATTYGKREGYLEWVGRGQCKVLRLMPAA